MLILPDHPLFNYYLHTPPPDWRSLADKSGEEINFVLDSETGIFRSANQQELKEYLEGGEYDYLMGEKEEDDYELD